MRSPGIPGPLPNATVPPSTVVEPVKVFVALRSKVAVPWPANTMLREPPDSEMRRLKNISAPGSPVSMRRSEASRMLTFNAVSAVPALVIDAVAAPLSKTSPSPVLNA